MSVAIEQCSGFVVSLLDPVTVHEWWSVLGDIVDALKEEANQEQLFFSLPKIHVMVLHLYSVFSTWTYSNALYNA